MEVSFTNDGLIGIAIVFGVIVFMYLIVREIRLMRTNNRKLELELEREKLSVLRQDTGTKGPSLIQLTDGQLDSLRDFDDINGTLDKSLFVKQNWFTGGFRGLRIW